MVIALIHWKIKPDMVREFLEYWRTKAVVQDRSGLIGEFLSEPCDISEYQWITWYLAPIGENVYTSFINVGIWDNAEGFHDQIGKYFKEGAKRLDFEHCPRTRTILRPDSWRVGHSSLPLHDSRGTL